MKATVIYHSADFDGIFCREIARKFLPEAELIGWNFGEPTVPMPMEGTVYVLDLPPSCLCKSLDVPGLPWERIVWIDHHKSSIESHPKDIPGYRIDGVAACRLAWQWFAEHGPLIDVGLQPVLPAKEDYVQRSVKEPLAVRLAGEYDIWDHRGDGDLELQYGLRTVDLADPEEDRWGGLLSDDPGYADELIDRGAVAMRYSQQADAATVNHRSYVTEWEGMKFLTLNTARANSLTFAARDVPETGHDALLAYYFNGKVWSVSLYHAKHRTELDLSLIAVKHGGGGHRGACGFTCERLPFGNGR